MLDFGVVCAQSFDLGQKRGRLGSKKGSNYCPKLVNALPLHRQNREMHRKKIYLR